MPTLTKLISMQEASQHASKDDCWIIIDGKEYSGCSAVERRSRADRLEIVAPVVYDVTSYLEEHPGGDDVVLEATAKDATDEFEDAGHSDEARELLEQFCIGELDVSSPVIPELEVFSKKQPNDYAEKLLSVTKQYWVVPAAVIGLSVVVGFLYLRKK